MRTLPALILLLLASAAGAQAAAWTTADPAETEPALCTTSAAKAIQQGGPAAPGTFWMRVRAFAHATLKVDVTCAWHDAPCDAACAMRDPAAPASAQPLGSIGFRVDWGGSQRPSSAELCVHDECSRADDVPSDVALRLVLQSAPKLLSASASQAGTPLPLAPAALATLRQAAADAWALVAESASTTVAEGDVGASAAPGPAPPDLSAPGGAEGSVGLFAPEGGPASGQVATSGNLPEARAWIAPADAAPESPPASDGRPDGDRARAGPASPEEAKVGARERAAPREPPAALPFPPSGKDPAPSLRAQESFAARATSPVSEPARADRLAIAAGAVAGFLALVLAALYNRLSRGDLLGSRTRAAILGLVRQRPGVTEPEVAQALGVHVSTVAYHTRRLHVQRCLRVGRVGRYRVLYAAEASPSGDPKAYWSQRGAKKEILAALSAGPARSQKELAEALGMSRHTLGYHLDHLASLGLVERVPAGRRRVYALAR